MDPSIILIIVASVTPIIFVAAKAIESGRES